jgi:hypothetical protein
LARSTDVVQIDPDGQQFGAHQPDEGSVQAAAQHPLTGDRVVVRKQVGRAGAPATADEDAHARVRGDVADIARLAAVLGDDPERVPVEAVALRPVVSRIAQPRTSRSLTAAVTSGLTTYRASAVVTRRLPGIKRRV